MCRVRQGNTFTYDFLKYNVGALHSIYSHKYNIILPI